MVMGVLVTQEPITLPIQSDLAIFVAGITFAFYWGQRFLREFLESRKKRNSHATVAPLYSDPHLWTKMQEILDKMREQYESTRANNRTGRELEVRETTAVLEHLRTLTALITQHDRENKDQMALGFRQAVTDLAPHIANCVREALREDDERRRARRTTEPGGKTR